MSDTKDNTRPMTADKFWATDQQPDINPFAEPFEFAEAYATYRLQFERRQHQNSWMPTEDEWRRFPESKCAAMDNYGEVYTFSCNLEDLELGDDCWLGEYPYYLTKTVDPTNLNWRQCKVARPEGV